MERRRDCAAKIDDKIAHDRADPILRPAPEPNKLHAALLLKFASDGRRDGPALFHQPGEVIVREGLRAVLDRLLRMRVDLNDETVRAACDGGLGHRPDELRAAGALAGIDDD